MMELVWRYLNESCCDNAADLLPWCGYFALMQTVDTFTDSVQFAKRSWQQRNQIKTANGAKWLTVPVISKGKRQQHTYEAELDDSRNFASTHRKSIESNMPKHLVSRVLDHLSCLILTAGYYWPISISTSLNSAALC